MQSERLAPIYYHIVAQCLGRARLVNTTWFYDYLMADNNASNHRHLIETFYTAFSKRDYAGMAACYHPDVEFKDEAFDVTGNRAKAMWHMLCERGKDLVIEFDGVEADETSGKAHWEAKYSFSATGRKVHNIIDARFEFADGLIVKHIDRFNFWKWSSQALGISGTLLGWTPILRNAVRKKAAAGLDAFIRKHADLYP